mmetsp:Transcript_21322/g.34696  ORF Transcript_21322/g.34696 Transcript_21322/m.34696 type:complete len:172 (+) Transcript_21322:219-734(+)
MMPHVIQTSKFLVNASRVLEIPCIVTEQYPKGLLHTVSEIDVKGLPVFEKTDFTMLVPQVEKCIADMGTPKDTAVLFGIEGHVCVQQTALDLLAKGWNVHLVADGISSSKPLNRTVALQRLQDAGALLTTSEAVVFEIMRSTSCKEFKTISKLVKENNASLGELDVLLSSL